MKPSAPRRVLIAPDSFKGTLTAAEVAAALAAGVRRNRVEVDCCPLADGGEGTMRALLGAGGGEIREAEVSDPIGRPLVAEFALIEGGDVAVLDSAAASGLPLVEPEVRDAIGARTTGTGELIVAAIGAGASRVVVAAGGSATTDGGLGAIQAIGDAGGLRGAKLTVLCDVQTAFEDAAEVFAPQKGAGAADVAFLSERLGQIAEALPKDPRGRPMTGCAGGLSGGLWAAFDAELLAGTDYIFASLRIRERVAAADLVITGEGQIDSQSLEGKLVGSLADLCEESATDLHVVVGRDALPPADLPGTRIRSIQEAGTRAALAAAAERILAGSAPRRGPGRT